mmetsp:Transcript_19413/g.58478  ORF Transcript_19413/g.58478 Transcript_19413/m.58478 type:complete len:232 (+) Transcript_19413:929-1624(+)
MLELPVRITIRMCSDDPDVVGFYGDIDKDVEMPLDILDDFAGEARKVGKYNPWLVYTPLLHTIREAGTFVGILDYIDERRLTPMEAAFCSQLLLQEQGQPAYPRDPQSFLDAIECDISAAPKIYDIRRRAFRPPLDVQALKVAVLPRRYAGLAGAARKVGLGCAVDWYLRPAGDETRSDSEDLFASWVATPRRAACASVPAVVVACVLAASCVPPCMRYAGFQWPEGFWPE